MIFVDRFEAGRRLAQALVDRVPDGGAVILGLTPGGVPVASEVARHLGLALDVFVLRKLAVPGHPELAAGAVTSGGARVFDEETTRAFGLGASALDEIARREERALAEKEALYRGDRPPLRVDGRTVILVDDALATGATVAFAVRALERLGADRVVVAVPVGPAETCEELCRHVDDLVCLSSPEPFHGSASAYGAFHPVADSEVRGLLA